MQSTYGQTYAHLYRNHWWWRSRERILVRVLESLPLPRGAELLDVGCGDGLFFPKLRRFGSVRGIEADSSLLDPQNPDIGAIFSEPLGAPRYAGWSFDLITALDVVEHIADDRTAATQLVDMLKPGGFLVLTVPAFMSLWDEHDVVNQHYRRYTLDGVRTLLAGLGTLRDSRYLFHALFVPKYLIRLINRSSRSMVDQAGIPNATVNQTMTALCDWENRLLAPARLPFGTSVLAVLQKEYV